MIKRLMTLAALLMFLLAANAQADNDGGQESLFSMGMGARALSMGSSFTALANDASLLYYNPAGLSFLVNQEVSFMHARLYEGTNYNFAGWVMPIGERSGTGIGFMRVGTDGIIGRENFIVTDTSDFSHTQIVFAYAYRLGSRLSFGANFKVVNQSLAGLSDYAYGGDLGAIALLSGQLSFGFVARDLVSPNLTLDSTGEEIPGSYSLGVAYKDIKVSDQLRFTIVSDLEKNNHRHLHYHGGAEALFGNRFAIRGGIDEAKLTVGVGLRVGQLKIDYAFNDADVLNDTHRFSFTWLLGKPRQPEPIFIDRIMPPAPLTEAQKAARDAKQIAHSFFQKNELDSALHYYHESFEYDHTDEETSRMIAAINSTLEAEKNQGRVDTLIEREQFTDRYFNQAQQFYDKKLYSAASDLLSIILEIDPGYAPAHDLAAQINQSRHNEINSLLLVADSAKAAHQVVDEIQAYNRILELDAGMQSVIDAKAKALAGLDLTQQLNLGIRLYTEGKYNVARRHFEAVLKSNPDDQVAQEYLNKIKADLAGPSSLEELQQNKEIWALYLQGIRYMRNAEYQQAIDAWEKILKVFPNNVNTLNNLEQARLRLESEKRE